MTGMRYNLVFCCMMLGHPLGQHEIATRLHYVYVAFLLASCIVPYGELVFGGSKKATGNMQV